MSIPAPGPPLRRDRSARTARPVRPAVGGEHLPAEGLRLFLSRPYSDCVSAVSSENRTDVRDGHLHAERQFIGLDPRPEIAGRRDIRRREFG